MRNLSLNLVGSAALLSAVSGYCDVPTWTEVERHKVGGAGGWDLLTVDADLHRVFVTRGDHLQVVDIGTGHLIGDIMGLKRVHGVAIVVAKKRGCVTSGGNDRVVAFDLDDPQTARRHPDGKNPDAIVFDLSSGQLIAFNGHSNDATVIDPATNQVVATTPLPGKPELGVRVRLR